MFFACVIVGSYNCSLMHIEFIRISEYNKLYKTYFTHSEDRAMKKPKGKYAWTVTVGEKGQIVIPKQAREIFGIKPGDTLIMLGDENKGLAIPPKSTFTQFAAAIFETNQVEEGEE